MEKTYFGYIEDLQKYFKAYCILTVISGILDFFNFVIIMHHYSEPGREYEEMFLLILTLVFWGCNSYWAGYVYLLYFKFPDYIGKYLNETLFGVGVIVDKKLKKWTAQNKAGAVRATDGAKSFASKATKTVKSRMNKPE